MRMVYLFKDRKKISEKYNYVCNNCGSTKNLQSHDPTKQHTDWQTGVLLCGICHSKEHPNRPNKLFAETEYYQYWTNISVRELADKVKCCTRTIIRKARKIGIKSGGILSGEDKNKLLNSFVRFRKRELFNSFYQSNQIEDKLEEKGMIAKELVDKLRAKGYTKTDIASRLGVREYTLYRWEKGLIKPKKAFLEMLKRMLEVKKK